MSKVYPIAFTNRECTKCGAKNSLRYIDKYDHIMKDEIYPISKMYCTSCNTDFYIRWIKPNESEEKMIPIICSDNLKDKVELEMIEFAKSKRRKI